MGIFKKKHDIEDIYGVKSSTWLEKKAQEAMGEDVPETGFRHSRQYHVYFRGYTELREVNEKGRVTFKRYYTAPWMMCDLIDRDYWLLRVIFFLCAAIATALMIGILIRPIPCMSDYDTSWIVAIPGFPAVICTCIEVIQVLSYAVAPRKMTLGQYTQKTGRMKTFSLISGIAGVVCGLDMTVYAIVDGRAFWETVICAALMIVAGVLVGAIFFLEKKVPYKEVPNDTKVPEGDTYLIE